MSNEIWLEGSWREGIEITIDSGDMKMNATVTRKAFEEALANIDGDISEWMAKRVIGWIDDYFDEGSLTDEEFDMIRKAIEEARP